MKGEHKLLLQLALYFLAVILWGWGSRYIPYRHERREGVLVRTHWWTGEKQALLEGDGWYAMRGGVAVNVDPVSGYGE